MPALLCSRSIEAIAIIFCISVVVGSLAGPKLWMVFGKQRYARTVTLLWLHSFIPLDPEACVLFCVLCSTKYANDTAQNVPTAMSLDAQKSPISPKWGETGGVRIASAQILDQP